MSLVFFAYFLANLILAMTLLRVVQYTWPDSWVGTTLGVIV